jgi:hypothetical protein
MSTAAGFSELIEKNLFGDLDWGPFVCGEGPLPKRTLSGRLVVDYLFYLGEHEKAKAVCEMLAKTLQKRYEHSSPSLNAYSRGFESALYYDLARQSKKANPIWREIELGISNLDDKQILKQKKGNLWIYLSYALIKLGLFAKVRIPAEKGREAIERGKGTHKAPHRNSREFALGPLLIQIAEYKLNGDGATKESVQEASLIYKKGKRSLRTTRIFNYFRPSIFIP